MREGKFYGNLKRKINKQREYFSTGETKDINFRIEKLKKLRDVLKSEEEKVFEALKRLNEI